MLKQQAARQAEVGAEVPRLVEAEEKMREEKMRRKGKRMKEEKKKIGGWCLKKKD